MLKYLAFTSLVVLVSTIADKRLFSITSNIVNKERPYV
jgi:hypothetical protein